MIVIKKINLEKSIYVLVCACYAFMFTLIPNSYFKDRINYLLYAEFYDSFISLLDGKSFITSEILFLYINKILDFIFIPENTVYFLVFLINFILAISFFVYSRNGFLAFLGLLAFFLMPFGLSYQLGSLRQSIAVSFFLIAVLKIKKINILLIVISIILGFIHVSFFIMTLLLIVDYCFTRFFSENKALLRVFVHFLFILAIGLLLYQISSVFDVGKLEGYLDLENSSGYFFIFFIPILLSVIYNYVKSKSIDTIGILSIIGMMSYIVFYFLSPIAGRTITLFIPFIYLSLTNKLTPIRLLLLSYAIVIGALIFFRGGYLAIMTI